MKNIVESLLELKDDGYKEFNQKLIPNINKDTVTGIRTPILRQFAKDNFGSEWVEEFLNTLPHSFFEENNLHAFLIEQIKDFETAMGLTEKFLPYINNWATCDSFFPKVFKKNISKVDEKIFMWIESDHEYTVRYALGLIMRLHLDDDFDLKYLDAASKIRSDKYYVNMMIAWLFATAIAKKEEYALDFIYNKKLSPWVHNKTIQKALESSRIKKPLKELLKKHKITQ